MRHNESIPIYCASNRLMKKRGTLSRDQVVDDTYHILFYIGEGTFGEMYRVHHKYLGNLSSV